MLNLEWVRPKDNLWYSLLALNLDHRYFDGLEGVYIIWHGGETPAAIRIGQGLIRDRLKEHSEDPDILFYGDKGLYVTWAHVSPMYRNGVERYLAERYPPKIGTRFPDDPPIEVNLL